MTTIEETIKKELAREIEIKSYLATIILEDASTQDEIESYLDDRFPKRFNFREEPSEKQLKDALKYLLEEKIYQKVTNILHLKSQIKDIVNNKKSSFLRLTVSSLMKIQALFDQKTDIEEKKLAQTHKRGRPLPTWLLNLKKGQYTVSELVEISKTEKRNVQKTMKKYCKIISYVDVGDYNKKCVYHWE